MYNEQSSSRLTNVTFSDNKAESGGGMYNYQASSVFTNVTFSGNTATTKNGGGVYYEGSSPINLTNVTFSDNEATLGSGGGIYSDNGGRSGLVVTNSLFWGNSAGGSGNQIYLYNNNSGVETLQIYNSIVEDGIKGPGSSPSGIGYYDTTYSGIINVNITFDQIVTVNPDLQPLADNGGFVETHALLSGSSALDLGLYVRQSITTPTTWYYSLDNVDWYTDLANPGTGSPQGSTKNMTATDARSYTRNTRPDIGAFEEGATPPILDGLNGKSASVP